MSFVRIRLYGNELADYRKLAGIENDHIYPFTEYIRDELPADDDMLFPSLDILNASLRRKFADNQAVPLQKIIPAECRFTDDWSGLRHEVVGYVGKPQTIDREVQRLAFLTHLLIQPADTNTLPLDSAVEPDWQMHNEAVMYAYDDKTLRWKVVARILHTWDKEQSVSYDANHLQLPDLKSDQQRIDPKISRFFNQLVRNSLEVITDQAVA